MLAKHGGMPEEDMMILISDGKENIKPYVSEVMPRLRDRTVELNSVLISDDADPAYARVSDNSTGTSYFNKNGTGLFRHLRTMMSDEYSSSPGYHLVEVS